MNTTFGFVNSNMTGVADASDIVKVPSLPDTYDLSKQLNAVIDQGNIGMCVSCSLGESIEFKLKQKNKAIDIPPMEFYDLRKDKKVYGMSPREAIEIAISKYDINMYAKIQDPLTLRASVISNGPCVIGLPVYSMEDSFWKGKNFLGGHAVSVVGWNGDSFIIKNSWGKNFANNGYTYLPFNEFKYILEAWTIID